MKKLFLFITGTFLFFIQYVNAQTNVSGVISSDATWTKSGSPYNVTNNLLINASVTLNIEPGVIINITDGKKIIVDGTMLSIGITTDSIKFTGNNWYGIDLINSTNCKFSYTIIEKIGINGVLSFGRGSVIDYCRISDCQTGGGTYFEANSQLKYSNIFNHSMQLFLNTGCRAIGNRFSNSGTIQLRGIGCFFSHNKVSSSNSSPWIRLYKGVIESNDLIFNKTSVDNSAVGIRYTTSTGESGQSDTIRYNKLRNFPNAVSVSAGTVIINNNSFIGTLNLNSNQRNLITPVVAGVDKNWGAANRVVINAKNNYWANINPDSIPVAITDYLDDFTNIGEFDYSNRINYHSNLAPIEPTGNVAKKVVNGNVVVTWKANEETDLAGYKIYYGTYNGNSFNNVIDIGNVTTYTLPAGVTLTNDIAVTAYDVVRDGIEDQRDGNESDYSFANLAPSSPANLLINGGPHKIRLSWDLSSSTAVNNYNIYRSTDGTSFNKITSVVSNTYTDANLTAYTKYFYKVTAFDSLDASYDNYGLESIQSAAVNATPNNLIYVDATTGSDVTGLGSIEKPYAKISTGTSAAIAGDSILIGNGTYSDNIQFQNKSLFIIGTNGANHVLIKSLQSTQTLNVTNAGNTFIKGLTFANLPSGSPGAAILSTGSNLTIESCIFRDNSGLLGVIYNQAGSFTFNNCIGYNNTSNYFFNASTSITTPIQINHFTYTNNTGTLLNTSNSIVDTVARIKNSIIWSNTNVTYSGKVAILNSVIKGGYSGNATNLNSSPRFVDSLNKDYHLLKYSPAIGLGLKNIGVVTDFDNNSRALPIGSNPDAGAYESNFGQPVPTITSISTSDKSIQLVFSVPAIQNIKKINLYRDTIHLPIVLRDTTAITKLSYTDSVSNQIKYNYRITTVNVQGVESDFSNILSAVALNSPQLIAPANNIVKSVLSPTFSWTSVPFATKYQHQIDTSVQFNSPIKRNDTLSTITQNLPLPLLANTTYYWQVRSGDNTGWSNWSNIFKFQTIITPPLLVSVSPANKRDTLKWNKATAGTVSFYKIYRDTLSSPTKLIDSVTGDKLIYLDTTALSLNVKYYYSIRSVNAEGVESNMSNILSGTPFNALPVPVALKSKTFDNTGEFNTVRLVYSAAGSVDSDGKIIGYKWYVNDSLVNQTDSILIYYFNQGLNDLKLVVTDNDGSTASSSAQVKMSAFVKKFKGGILGGITALNENTLYTADSTYDAANGASVYKIDRTGTTIFPLIVSSKIFTTPSVSSDSSVFITSGSSLNGFNSSGAPLWPTIPLGGLSYVTPTIDSVQNRLYVGVSNTNFFAIDYRTGKVVWNVICDAPINSSAIITGDRKLIFGSDNGTLYGFDLRTISGQPSPTWKYTIQGKIAKSPAIDSSNNLYFGTVSGNLVKLKLEPNGIVSTIWSVVLSAEVKSSPVIDAKGFVYVGTESGKFYKLNPDNGNIIWTYSSKGAIRSTPTISGYGNIYLADISGYITSLSENGIVNWKYQDSSAISSNLLTINNITYVGTEGGRLIGFYDNPTTNTVNTLLSYNFQKKYRAENNGSMASVNQFSKLKLTTNSILDAVFLPPPPTLDLSTPIWGTFQGNYRRTGSKIADCPDKPDLLVVGNTTICNGDSIQLTTSAANKFSWLYNNAVVPSIANTSKITVKQPGKYSVLAFGGKTCTVSSDTITIEAQSSPIKAVVNRLSLDTTICFRDSVVLQSSNFYDRYLWSNGDTLQTIIVKKSDKINLKGASKASSCFSLPSAHLVLIKNLNILPNISFGNNSLISTKSSYYKWFLNNNIATGISGSSYINPTSGVYRVETSLDNYCWDASLDYAVVLNNAPIVNDTVSVTIYPNPSIGTFNVVASFEKVTNVITKIFVADITGKVVYQTQKLLFFSNKIIIPVNLGSAKGTFAVNMDINGSVKSVIVVVN